MIVVSALESFTEFRHFLLVDESCPLRTVTVPKTLDALADMFEAQDEVARLGYRILRVSDRGRPRIFVEKADL